MRPIKIMLCDDDAEKRHYLQLLLAGYEGFELVGVFGEGEAAVAAAPALLPDVVLMDLDLPGISGIEATRQLKAVLPAIHVVIYTVFEDDDRIFDALSAGASGYLLKKTPPAQLTEAVQEVLVGGAALSPGIAHRILGHFSCKASKSQPALDELEREILKCLAAGIPIKGIVPKVAVPEGEPRMSGRIILSQEYVDLLTTGKVAAPRFSLTFPAQRIETELEWDDLVLHPDTLQQIRELEVWIKHGDTLMDDWGMRRKLKPGYRALFHGPPGTGKTLTASLLGKYTGKDVYRIDLSMVVSKYIGETEKNLANLFAKAENKNWILFFDEADALFGKRTNVRDAHDKYANQEVSYLLQRVELYDGLVILATNFKSNIDEAFSRRFQSIIYFPAPGFDERLRLWRKAFPTKAQLSPDINLSSLAQKHELTGAEIINIVQYACLRTLDRHDEQILFSDLYEGIKKEFQKEGRILR